MPSLHRLQVANFRSLQMVDVRLSDFNVLVGPNAAGKSNLLEVIQFLGDTTRLDLLGAIKRHGGYRRIRFRGGDTSNDGGSKPRTLRAQTPRRVRIRVDAQVTQHASENALDEYTLEFWVGRTYQAGASEAAGAIDFLKRSEAFKFKRTKGRGRRIRVSGQRVEVVDDGRQDPHRSPLASTSAALSTLPRMTEAEGAVQVRALAQLFSTFRVYNVDVAKAIHASSLTGDQSLDSDASNLAAFLEHLRRTDEDRFLRLQEDLAYIVPGIRRIDVQAVGGGSDAYLVSLEEFGLSSLTSLADASFGTVRALALLAMLHDPSPPRLTCVEEIDHGLHPYALDRIIERLREASERTQILIATHSPALVNRLEPHELIVCERDPVTGASRIPAIDPHVVAKMSSEDELQLGELWFSGALGGVPP